MWIGFWPAGLLKDSASISLALSQIPSSFLAENEQVIRFIFIWQTIYTLLTSFWLPGLSRPCQGELGVSRSGILWE